MSVQCRINAAVTVNGYRKLLPHYVDWKQILWFSIISFHMTYKIFILYKVRCNIKINFIWKTISKKKPEINFLYFFTEMMYCNNTNSDSPSLAK